MYRSPFPTGPSVISTGMIFSSATNCFMVAFRFGYRFRKKCQLISDEFAIPRARRVSVYPDGQLPLLLPSKKGGTSSERHLPSYSSQNYALPWSCPQTGERGEGLSF